MIWKCQNCGKVQHWTYRCSGCDYANPNMLTASKAKEMRDYEEDPTIWERERV